jgi:hypothetical protein
VLPAAAQVMKTTTAKKNRQMHGIEEFPVKVMEGMP